MKGTTSAALGAVMLSAALVLTGCAHSPAPASATAASSPSSAPAAKAAADVEAQRIRGEAPAFKVVQAPTSGDGAIRVTVDRAINGGEAYAIMQVLMLDYTDEGGYNVSINCSTGGTATADQRLANGTMAVGKLGQARTGFVKDGATVELVKGATCPVVIPVAPADALTAQQVVDGFAAAGLPVTDARDNTGSNCSDRGCAQMITTEDVTVLSFPDAAAATVYVKTWGPADLHHLGTIVLSYAAARTPVVARPRYEATLVTLQSGKR